jgi:hypothetical protein
MHYTLLFYESSEDFSLRTDSLCQQEYSANWSHYVKALRESGIVVSGSGLYPPETATTLRRRDGEMLVQDGPITETKEQLGGFFIIDDRISARHSSGQLDVPTIRLNYSETCRQ